MKIGDYVTTQEIASQSECRWVVLTNLVYRDYGGYEGTEGGTIAFIGHTKAEAGEIDIELNSNGVDTLLVCGAFEPLCVGGIFVE
jgi:hypothetical protein